MYIMYFPNRLKAQVVLLSTLTAIALPACAHSYHKTCAQQHQDIEQQAAYARQYQNSSELNRLKEAHAKINTSCDDNDTELQYQHDINKLKARLIENQNDLAQARAQGDAQHINRARKRLSETTQKLQQAEAARSEFHEHLK